MSAKTALEMINGLDEELLLGALEEPAPKKKTLHFKKLRWVAAAAAVALFAAVPVIAYTFNLTAEYYEESDYWSVYSEEARFALDEFSTELLKEAYEEEAVSVQRLFQRKEELEEFLGIKMPKNKALKVYNLNTLQITDSLNKSIKGRYMMFFGKGNTEDLIRVSVHTSYNDENFYEYVNYEFITEKMPYKNAGSGWQKEMSSRNYTDPKKYTAPDGRECVVAEIEHKSYRHEMGEWGYVGITMAGRVNVAVEVRGFDKEATYNRLIEILDNFE